MSKVLVTGATGFIGNHVINELLKKGHAVIASSLSMEKAREQTWFSAVDYRPFDFNTLVSSFNTYDYFGRPDCLIHLAWEGLPNYTSDFHLNFNLPKQQAFIANMIENGLSDLTITGTCFEYGMRDGKLDETMEPAPDNAYAKAKDRLRRFVEDSDWQHPLDFRWIRLFYMYGPGQNPKSLLSQLQSALDAHASEFNMSGGMQVRDYLPVEKVAEYIVLIALQRKVRGVINCCSGQPITVKELVEQYLHSRQASIRLNLGYYPYASYEPMAFWGDTSKLKQLV